MTFPQELDMDRVLGEALKGIQIAANGWLAGQPTSEEPLMSRLTEEFTRRRRQCDVGVRVPVGMTAKIAYLHRRGHHQTDAYGADLAITIEIPDRSFRKTALFQIKVSENFSARIERKQLETALKDYRTRDRSFVLVADRVRERMRVTSVNDAIGLIKDEDVTATIDCAQWMTMSEWIIRWISCELGPASTDDGAQSVELLLQHFNIEPSGDWESPWGNGDPQEYPDNQLPAKAWLEMISSNQPFGVFRTRPAPDGK